MRIVAGKHRGAKLTAPERGDVRPTSDRAREALFSMLTSGRFGEVLRDRVVLDLFAGTGALGLEALSRGAAHVVLVENDRGALATIRANIAKLRADEHTTVRDSDATGFGERAEAPAGLVLMDPPYRTGLWLAALKIVESAGWIDDNTVVAIEVAKSERIVPTNGFEILDDRRHGAARLVLMRRERLAHRLTPAE